MNAFAKRALILTLLVLCLFGITILGASAASNTGYATDADALAADSTFVARVGEVGTSATYYTSVAEAVKAAGSTETTIYVLADFTIDGNNYVTLGDNSDDIVLHQSIILKGVDLDGDGKYPTINGSRNRNFVNYDASDLAFENLNIIGNGRLIQHYNGGSADNHNKLIFGNNVHVNVTPTGGEDWIHASTTYFDFTLAESASITATYTSRGQKQNLFTVSGGNSVLNIYGDIAMTASNITDTTHQTHIINGTPTVNIYKTANITFNADTSKYKVAPFSGVGAMCFEGTYNGAALTEATASACGLKVFIANPDNTTFGTTTISNAYFAKAQDNATFYVLANTTITTDNYGISKTVKITSKAGGTYKLTTSSYAFFTLCEGGNLTLENIELSYTGGSGSGRFARIDGSSNITLGTGTTVSTTAAIFIYSNGQNANSDVFYTFDIQSGATVNWNYATAADFIYHNGKLYSGKNNHVKGEIIVNGTLNFGTVAHTLVNDKNTEGEGAYNGCYILRLKSDYLSLPTVNPYGAVYLSGYETLDAADTAAKALGFTVRLGAALDANGGALYAYDLNQGNVEIAQNGDSIVLLDADATTSNFTLSIDGKTVTVPAASTLTNDEVAIQYGAIVRVGDNYYTTLFNAFAAAESESTITLLNNISVPADVTLDGKSLTIVGNNFAIAFGGNSIILTNGASLTINNAHITASGNNGDAPFVFNTSATKSTLKLSGCTAAVTADFIHVGGTDAVVAEIILENLTDTTITDTLLDHRNTSADSDVTLIIRESTLSANAGVYGPGSAGTLTIQGNGLSYTGGSFIKLEANSSLALDITLVGTKSGQGNAATHSNTFALTASFLDFMNTAKPTMLKARIAGTKIVTTGSSAYILWCATNMPLSDAEDDYEIDVEFEGVTLSTPYRAFSFQTGLDDPHPNVRIVFKDSSVTDGDKTTYSNELHAGGIGFLLRPSVSINVVVEGLIFTGGTMLDLQSPTSDDYSADISISNIHLTTSASSFKLGGGATAADITFSISNAYVVASGIFVEFPAAAKGNFDLTVTDVEIETCSRVIMFYTYDKETDKDYLKVTANLTRVEAYSTGFVIENCNKCTNAASHITIDDCEMTSESRAITSSGNCHTSLTIKNSTITAKKGYVLRQYGKSAVTILNSTLTSEAVNTSELHTIGILDAGLTYVIKNSTVNAPSNGNGPVTISAPTAKVYFENVTGVTDQGNDKALSYGFAMRWDLPENKVAYSTQLLQDYVTNVSEMTVTLLKNYTQSTTITLGNSANNKDGATAQSFTLTATSKDVVWTMSAGNTFYLYDGSDLTFTNMKMVVNNRLIHGGGSATTSATNTTKVVFGDNLTVTGTTGAETLVHIPGASYWDIDVNETATLNMSYTNLVAKNNKDDDSRRVIFEYNNIHGTFNLRGTITMTGTAAADTPGTPYSNKHFSVIYAGTASANARINIYSTASVTYSKPESFVDTYGWTMIASCVPVYFPDALANYFAEGETASHAALANRYQLDVMVVDANDNMFGTYYYANNAITKAPSGSTVTLLDDVRLDNVTNFNKALTITSVAGSTFTLSNNNTDTSTILFGIVDGGANLTFTNVKVMLTNRFMLANGDLTLTLGDKAYFETSNNVFIYSQEAAVQQISTIVVDFQYGSELKMTHATGNALIYQTGNKDYYPDKNYDQKRAFDATIYVSGKITNPFTGNGAIISDGNNNSAITVYYDASKAEITCPSASWFYLCDQNSVVYITGFETLKATDEFAVAHNMSIRSGDNFGTGIWVPYTGFRGQMNEISAMVLPEGENTIYILKNISSINSTMYFGRGATDTGYPPVGKYIITSAKLDGTQATIGFQGDAYRLQVYAGAEVIFDNIKITTAGKLFQFHTGTAKARSTIRFTNGASIVATVTKDTGMVSFAGDAFAKFVLDNGCSITQSGTPASDKTRTDMFYLNTNVNADFVIAGSITKSVTAANTVTNHIIENGGSAASTFTFKSTAVITNGSTGKAFYLLKTSAAEANTVTVENGATFTGFTTAPIYNPNGYGTFTGYTNVAEADELALSLGYNVRASADDAETAVYYPTLNMAAVNFATADATKAGTVTVLASHTPGQLVLGDGTDDADNYKTYDLTIVGKKMLGATEYPLLTYNGELFVFYDGSDLTLKNIKFSSANRWMRVYNTLCTDPCDIVFGAGATVTQTAASSNDDFILVSGASYANITIEQGAFLSRTLTAAKSTISKVMFSIRNMIGTFTIAGKVDYTAHCVLSDNGKPTPAYMFNMGTENGVATIIKSTADISFTVTGDYGDSRVCYIMAMPVIIEDGLTYNGTKYAENWKAAAAMGFAAQFTHVNDSKTYFILSLHSALPLAKPGSEIIVLKDTTLASTTLNKEITYTSSPDGPFTVTTSGGASSVLFWLDEGAKLIFTNIKFVLNTRGFNFRNSATLVFGDGADFTSNHEEVDANGNKSHIFAYANSNAVVNNIVVTIDFQEGSSITTTTNARLFYHNQDVKGTTTKLIVYANVYVAGKMNLATTSSGTIVNDGNNNGFYRVFYDATTANITSAGAKWFDFCDNGSVLYVSGFATVAEADAFAIAHMNAGVRSGNKIDSVLTDLTLPEDPDNPTARETFKGLAYTFSDNQINQVMVDVLPEAGGEITILRSNTGIWSTIHFNTAGPIVIKALNGVTVTNQGTTRMRIKTNVTFDGITLNLKGTDSNPNAFEISLGGKLTLNGCTVTVATGNNTQAPFIFAADGKLNSMHIIDSTIVNNMVTEKMNQGDIFVISAAKAVAKADIKIENSTITCPDTLVDYRNTDKDSAVTLTVSENSVLKASAGVYADGVIGACTVSFADSTFTGSTFIYLYGAASTKLEITVTGTKTGVGSSATHTTNFTCSTSWLHAPGGAKPSSAKVRVTGAKIDTTGSSGSYITWISGFAENPANENEYAYDFEFTDVTLSSKYRMFSFENVTEPVHHPRIRLVIKSSNVTPGDKSTYKSEISSGAITFLMRPATKIDLTVDGVIFTNGTAQIFNIQSPKADAESVNLTLNNVYANVPGQFISIAPTVGTVNISGKNVEVASCKNFLVLGADVTATINLENVKANATQQSLNFSNTKPASLTLSGTLSSYGKAPVDVTGTYTITGSTASLIPAKATMAATDTLAFAMGFLVRPSADQPAYMFNLTQASINYATANATKQGIIYLLGDVAPGALILGDGVDDKDKYTPYDVIIDGSASQLGKKPTITISNADRIQLYDGSSLEFRNITITSTTRWIRVYNTKGNNEHTVNLTFGDNVNINCPSATGTEDFIYSQGGSYVNMTFAPTSTITAKYTGVKRAEATDTKVVKRLIALNNSYGIFALNGRIDVEFNGADATAQFMMVYQNSFSGDVIIGDTAVINYTTTGTYASSIPFNVTGHMLITPGALFNGAHVLDDATALALGFKVRNTNTKGELCFYSSGLFRSAYDLSDTYSTYTLLADARISVYEPLEGKNIFITSSEGNVFKLTHTSSYAIFRLGQDTHVHFSDVTVELGGYRFARIDGDSSIVVGPGTTINCSANIFLYDNGNSAKQAVDFMIDFQAGSVVNWTSTSGNLIYHNGSNDWNGDGEKEKTIMNAVIYISGELNISSTTTGSITNDKEDSSDYFVYIDASTAKITSATNKWFYHSEAGSVVYITGFETLAEADAYAIAAGLRIRSGAVIGEGIWIPYTGCRGQIHQTALDVMPKGENTIYLIADVDSVYATVYFQGFETIKIVSAKPDGTLAKLGNQGSSRFRIRTNVIFENVNVALKTGPNIEVSLGGTLTLKNCSVTGTGNLTTPMTCLDDGNVNTIIFNNTSIETVLGAYTLNCTIVGNNVSDLGAVGTIDEADAVARAIGLVARVSDTKPIYAFGLNMVAVNYATNNENKSGTIYLIGNVTLSTQHQLTLGNTADDVYAPISLVIRGINIGTENAPAFPTITQTYGNRVISIYDGSDIAFYNVNFVAISRIIQVYAGSTADNHSEIVFGEGFKLTATKQSAESFVHANNCYCDIAFEEGSEFIIDVTIAKDTVATRRVILDYVNILDGELVIAGKLHYHVTDNNVDFSDEIIMLKVTGTSTVQLYKSAALDFDANAADNKDKIVSVLYTLSPVFLNDFDDAECDEIRVALNLSVKGVAPNGLVIISSGISGITKHIASGSVIYLYGDVLDYNIPITKQFTIKSAGSEIYTIKNSNASVSLFVFNGGSADAPAKLWLENVKIESGSNTAYIFDFCGTSYTFIDLENVVADYKTGSMGIVRDNATVYMTMQDVTMTAKGGFTIKDSTVFELTADSIDLTTVGAGDAYSVFHATCSSGQPVKIAITNSDLKTEGAAHGFYAMNPTFLQLKLTNVNMDVQHWAISSQANTHLEIDLVDCYIVTQTRRHTLRVYGVSGSYTNITNTTIINKAPYENDFTAAITAGTMLTLNIYSGYFESQKMAIVSPLGATVTINIYGGTFNYTGNDAGTSPVHVDAGVVNVYGGKFHTNSTLAPVFNNTKTTAGSLTLHAFVANGYTNLITNMGLGTPTANHTTGYGHTTMNGLMMTAGATPNFAVSGMKFMVTLNAATYAHICGLADDGENEVSYGMLLVDSSKMTEALADDFTHTGLAYLDFADYIELLATANDVKFESDGCVTVTLTLTESQMASVSTAYSVVAYAKYKVNGHDVYMYSNYNSAENSRSLEQIARSAYNDRKTSSTGSYTNLVAENSYSRYTAEELAQLATWCNDDTAQKVLDIYLVAGGSNAVGKTSFNEQFAEAFKNADVLNSNVFYSGIVADHSVQEFKLGTSYSTVTKYTASGTAANLGFGWMADQFGPELGMAKALAAQYNADSGKYAAVIKYAFADSNLADLLEGYDEFSGNWAPTGEEVAGEKSGALYTEYMNLVAYEIQNYVEQGYKVNIVGMYWMQGEDDIAANATASYADLFNTLVANVRSALTGIYYNETGANADFTAMPVVVGEVASFLGNKVDSKHDAFVTLQNTLTSISGVSVISNSEFPADANGIFINPDDMLLIGELAAAKLMNAEAPVITPAATVVDVDGNPVVDENGNPVQFRSLVMAAALVPDGTTLKLAGNQTSYTTLTFENLKNITIDGDGHAIVFENDANGMEFSNANVTLNNIQIIHTNENSETPVYAILGDKNSNIVLSGADTYVEAEKTAIMMNGANSLLVIEGGTYRNRTADSNEEAIIFTSKANVVIEDGEFEASAGSSCVYIDNNAPTKLAVNVKGGTFKTTDIIDRIAPIFVNNSVVAILVVAPDVVLDAGECDYINVGFGTGSTNTVIG